MGVCSVFQQQTWTVVSVPTWFRADSGTNLIKQGENVTGRHVARKLSGRVHARQARDPGSSPGRATFFFRPCDINVI